QRTRRAGKKLPGSGGALFQLGILGAECWLVPAIKRSCAHAAVRLDLISPAKYTQQFQILLGIEREVNNRSGVQRLTIRQKVWDLRHEVGSIAGRADDPCAVRSG